MRGEGDKGFGLKMGQMGRKKARREGTEKGGKEEKVGIGRKKGRE